jgi:uncharacterized SAM-dependent methyltransferase
VKYFKNTELAKLYNVSEKSVRNWIQAAQDGKLELQLYELNGKFTVANTSKNIALIESLVEKGKKFKNSRGHRVTTPDPKFYELYNQKQILDIISSITIHNEVPLQYGYSDGGASYWDQYATRLFNEKTSNILKKSIEMLDLSLKNIEHLIEGRTRINVVDLGPGNGLPIRNILSYLVDRGVLGRYIAIDSSSEMLTILGNNIEKWFDGKVNYEGYVRDFTDERFDDLLADEYAGDDANVPVNLVFIMGGTLSNFRSPSRVLQTINSSLGLNDLLFYTGYLDTPHSRRYFDFDVSSDGSYQLDDQNRLILNLLGIDEDLCEVEQLYSEEKQARSISVKPKIDLTIKFELNNGIRHVELLKGTPILLWRHRHYSILGIMNEFDNNGFELMQAMKSDDQEYMLIIEKIKTGD